MPRSRKLGEILIQMGAIDALQLQAALGHHEQWGMPLGQAVIEKRFCSKEDVLRALSLQTGHPAIDLDSQKLESRLVFTIPVKSAERHRAVPLRLEGKRAEVLVVAVAAPASLETLDALRSVSGKQRITAMVAMDDAIERAIGRLYYGRDSAPAPSTTPVPMNEPLPAEIATEHTFELESNDVSVAQAAAPAAVVPSQPAVLLYGWREAAAKALAGTLALSGISSRAATDEEVLASREVDVILAPLLSLETLFPAGAKPTAVVIVCGMPGDEDMEQARTFGARLYLRPPFSAERLAAAVRRCQPQRPPATAGKP